VGQQVDTVNAGGGEGEEGLSIGVHFTQKMHGPEHTYWLFHCLSEQWFSTRAHWGTSENINGALKDYLKG